VRGKDVSAGAGQPAIVVGVTPVPARKALSLYTVHPLRVEIFPTTDVTVESEKSPFTNELVKLIFKFFPAVPSSALSIAPITVDPDPVPLKTELPTTEIALRVVLADPTF
jgi:hypothetical protein